MAQADRLKQIAPGYYTISRSEADKKDLERTRTRILSASSACSARKESSKSEIKVEKQST